MPLLCALHCFTLLTCLPDLYTALAGSVPAGITHACTYALMHACIPIYILAIVPTHNSACAVNFTHACACRTYIHHILY